MSIMQHKGDYILLALIVGAYLASIIRFAEVPSYILLATIVFAALYMVWGIVHHLHTRSFSWRTMLEYFLVAILAVVIVSTLLV